MELFNSFLTYTDFTLSYYSSTNSRNIVIVFPTQIITGLIVL